MFYEPGINHVKICTHSVVWMNVPEMSIKTGKTVCEGWWGFAVISVDTPVAPFVAIGLLNYVRCVFTALKYNYTIEREILSLSDLPSHL